MKKNNTFQNFSVPGKRQIIFFRYLLISLEIMLFIIFNSEVKAQITPSISSSTKIVTEHLDRDMIKRNNNFGYTEQEIKKNFDYPLVYEYNYKGFAKELVKAPPASGIHPRVLFYKEDLPALRKKLTQTKPGQFSMDAIRKTLDQSISGPNATYGKIYEDAVNGIENPTITDVKVSCSIIYEAYRCLIDDDTRGGKRVAAAMTTLAKMNGKGLDEFFIKWNKKHAPGELYDYQEVKHLTQSGLFGLGYDFAFNWMTEEQRIIARETLSKATKNFKFIGCEALPAFPANTSNWIPMHTPFIFLCCSIEGEKGSDPDAYNRAVAAYKRYLSVGFFPSGEMFESMGKNFLCAQNLLPIGNRGDNLIALSQIRSQITNYYLNALDPWGGFFTFYDSLGGRGNVTPIFDVMIVKLMFPNDPTVDFIYRNFAGEDYEIYKSGVNFGHPLHLGDGLFKSIFCVPYDESKTYDQSHNLATSGKSLTYFSDDTGNMITRSDWGKDAVQLHSLTRCVAGGHVYADRSHFSLHALGRYWAIYKPLRQVEEHYLPKNRSVTLIDGNGPGFAPGKSLALIDNPEATFTVGDFKTSYDWTTGGNNRFPKGGVPVPFTANDFRLHKSDKPWMSIPYSELPNWQTSQKGSEMWLPNNPVQRAFRTTGLVRGIHPYVLVVDDFQKDAAQHDYQFGMILEDDLIQKSVEVRNGKTDFRNDLILNSNSTKDNKSRELLVRVLNANGQEPNVPAVIEKYSLPNPPLKNIEMNRLVINSKSIAPDFKLLLFPYREGQKLPLTVWNADRTALRVEWMDQVDLINFSKAVDGRTHITIIRNSKDILSL